DPELSDLNITTLDKYIYLLSVYFISSLINMGLWFNFTNIVNAIFFVFASPTIIFILCRNHYFTLLSRFIKDEINKIYLFFLCKITSKIINKLSEVCLDNKSNIDYKE